MKATQPPRRQTATIIPFLPHRARTRRPIEPLNREELEQDKPAAPRLKGQKAGFKVEPYVIQQPIDRVRVTMTIDHRTCREFDELSQGLKNRIGTRACYYWRPYSQRIAKEPDCPAVEKQRESLPAYRTLTGSKAVEVSFSVEDWLWDAITTCANHYGESPQTLFRLAMADYAFELRRTRLAEQRDQQETAVC